eukprot:411041-Pyramimonas_sp.AAC.1
MATVWHVAAPLAQGAARSQLDPCVPSLRGASREPVKMATVGRVAAFRGAVRCQLDPRVPPLRGQ